MNHTPTKYEKLINALEIARNLLYVYGANENDNYAEDMQLIDKAIEQGSEAER